MDGWSTTRRVGTGVLVAVLLAGTGCSAGEPPPNPTGTSSPSASATSDDARSALDRLERGAAARVGLYVVDTASGREIAYRADERFGYASTHKALSAAVMLDQNSVADLGERVRFAKADLVTYSPVTETRVATGMTLREIGDAAVRSSDNTAANLIFDEIGGPDAFDESLADIGDTVTVAERTETALNDTRPGDPRDTSTPRALARDLRHFVVEDGLPSDKRAILTDWLRRNTTGDELVRAAVPPGWVVGDKTGSGAAYGARNDIAVVWPPGREPIVIAVLTDHADPEADVDNQLVAEAARIGLRAVG